MFSVIIPILNPTHRLIDLIADLSNYPFFHVIVVNDGSGHHYQDYFDQISKQTFCTVISSPHNEGKGNALKKGIAYFRDYFPQDEGFVLADGDGQHEVRDIAALAAALEKSFEPIILGSRDLSLKSVPFKSRWGNRLTSLMVAIYSGRFIRDTQTGLRAFKRDCTDLCLKADGQRYDYEMNVLLDILNQKIPFSEVPIQTVYIDDNSGSHFHPFSDALLIYRQFITYIAVAVSSFAIDIAVFALLINSVLSSASFPLLYGTIIARLVSSLYNYTMNRNFVFNATDKPSSLIRYVLLCIMQLMFSWLLLETAALMTTHLTLSKIMIDSVLFVASYWIQKHYIFITRKLSHD